VDYSLFIMAMKVELLEGMEITPAVPPEFSPPIFNLPDFFFVFLCFGGALFCDPRGDPFYRWF
jgi:hypothetical protein